MPDDDLTLQMPGDEGAAAAPSTKKTRAAAAPSTKKTRAAAAPAAAEATETASDDSAGRIAQLEQELTQARALIEQLMDAQGADTAASPPKAKEVRTIGDDWSTMTAAQAKEAGVTKTVLCSDGYYVP